MIRKIGEYMLTLRVLFDNNGPTSVYSVGNL